MAQLHKLSPAKVKTATKGRHGDGGGLVFQVQGPHQRSWVFRYRSPVTGKEREMGLGSLDAVSISRARDLAADLRARVAAGADPIEARKVAEAAATPAVTFKQTSEAYITAKAAGWRNAKHASQWRATLVRYVYPELGDKPVADVSTDDVKAVLNQQVETRGTKGTLWTLHPETASRVRGRIEMILDAAKVNKLREGENPARWRGHLKVLMSDTSKVRTVKHHPALDWREAATFWRTLAPRPRMGAAALRFLILTAARSGEVRGMTWGEVDTDHAVWTAPGARMKAGRDHRVPLSDAALAVLAEVGAGKRDLASLVFPGEREGRPLSDMTLTAVLRRMERAGLTAHGFRSTFRDWAAETGQPPDLAEAALAHTLGSKVQAAYQRGDRLDRRRVLMQAWAEYLTNAPHA